MISQNGRGLLDSPFTDIPLKLASTEWRARKIPSKGAVLQTVWLQGFAIREAG